MLLLANYWGIDTQAFKTLDELNLYHIRGTGDVVEFVRVAFGARRAVSCGDILDSAGPAGYCTSSPSSTPAPQRYVPVLRRRIALTD